MNRLENTTGNQIRVSGGIRTAVFEVALVAIINEAVGDTDRGAAVGETVAELVDRLCLVQTGETQVILWAVNGDVLIAEFVKGRHEFLEVGFAALLAHELGGEVGVHAGAVPIKRLLEVGEDGLAAPLDVDAVAFSEAGEDVTSDPHLIRSALGAFAENLEFPLAFGDLGVDPFEVNTGIKADIDVLFGDLAGDVAYILVADAGVIRALGRWITAFGETEGAAVLIEEIFLFKAVPSIGVIWNGGSLSVCDRNR